MTRLGELSDELRERSVRVFDYLVELSQQRTKTIRDISKYQDVFWFGSLPSDEDCHTVAWGCDDDEHPDEIWLEIRRRAEPKCPLLPEECKEWVDARLLHDSDNEPQLCERIPVQAPPASESDNIVAPLCGGP